MAAVAESESKLTRRPAVRAGRSARAPARASARARRQPTVDVDEGPSLGATALAAEPAASALQSTPPEGTPPEGVPCTTSPSGLARADVGASRPNARSVRAPAGQSTALAAGSRHGEGEAWLVGTGELAVIITGICGRMGKLLARRLHRVQRVIGVDRRRFEGKPEDIIHHQIDLRRRKLRDVIRAEKLSAVVHLGTMHNLRESDRNHHVWNVVGFQKLLEHLAQYQVPKLVVLSTASLYGPSPENPQFLTEDAPLLGAQEFSQIRDLVEVDMLAQSFFWKEPQVETVILRPCHILGRVRNAPSNYARMERPVMVMGFDPMMQVIHERDVIEAILLSLRPGVRGVYNLRGPGELPLSRMLRRMGKRPMAVPGPLIRTVLSRLWSYRAVSFPTPELDHLRYLCLVDDTRARSELGFAPRYGLDATLRAPFSER